MIVGSVAMNYYCVPRSTQDADIVIESQLVNFAHQLSRRLEAFQLDPQLGFESVTSTTKALLHTKQHDFHIELFGLSDDEHDQARFKRRVRIETLETHAWIATADDLIINKLRWALHAGREKDVADVRNLISVQNEFLDWPYIEGWCNRHGTRELLDQLRREAVA
jgi:hypothetical protein